MLRTMILAAFGLTVTAATLAITSVESYAYSNNHCREYTRTVYIGGRAQDAYGTACLQSDGSWMIVGEGLGNDIPSNVSGIDYVIRNNNRYITPNRVVYYNTRPVYTRVNPAPVFIWQRNDNRYYRNGHHISYRKHDRHDNRGRGHGHGRHHNHR